MNARKIILFLFAICVLLSCEKKSLEPGDIASNNSPIITDLYRSHEIPDPQFDIVFKATISDPDSDPLSAYVHHDIGEGYSALEMESDDSVSTLYSATLSRLPVETHCRYFFFAEDNRGAVAFSDTLEFDVIYWFPTLYTMPVTDSVTHSQNTRISVRLGSVIDLFAISMTISYDSTIINADTILTPEAGIWGNNDPLLFYQRVEGGVAIAIGISQTPEDDNITGFGGLFDVVFTGVGIGFSDIDFYDVMILDEDGVQNQFLDHLRTKPATIYVE